MSRVVMLHDLDPFEKFAWRLHRSREANERAYLNAWAASDEANRLMKEAQHTWALTREAFLSSSPWPQFEGRTPAENVDELYTKAFVEDEYCDSQATVVIVFADDLLQSFGRGVLGKPVGYDGYGKTFNGGVRLTEMLRATTANVRHVSEWEDIPFPYADPQQLEKGDRRLQALKNIDILKRAFGVGETGPIRDVSTWRALTQIDGLYGTHPPDYQRIENALIDAARDIARKKSTEALSRLESELERRRATA